MNPELKASIETLSKYCENRWEKYKDIDFGGCTPKPCKKCELVEYCEGVIPQWVI